MGDVIEERRGEEDVSLQLFLLLLLLLLFSLSVLVARYTGLSRKIEEQDSGG